MFPALLKDLAPNVQVLGAFGFDDDLEVFLKTPLRHRAIFANSVYDHGYFLKISFLFSKEEPVLLA